MPRRSPLFADEPISDLRGLATLTDPDDEVAAVIDLAVMGARGDGKTQFLVHAIRALHARAPALAGTEQELNRQIMRLVLDPRAPRPDATPPGVLPHFTFRVRAAALYDRLPLRPALALARRLARVGGMIALAALLLVAGVAVACVRGVAPGVIIGGCGAVIGAIAAITARRRIERAGDIEIAFWDVAGEQIYSSTAADYHAVMGRLVDARRRRAESLGRAYVFAPILICNPLALGALDEGSPYVRLRALLPLFAAIDREASCALVAVNRWSVVEKICTRGASRDEVVAVTACPRGEPDAPPQRVAREHVRVHCLDAEDGRDGDIRLTYVRYDTAIRSQVEETDDDGSLRYEYDDGPGTFSGDAHRRFLDWLIALPRWDAVVPAPAPVPASEPAVAPPPPAAQALLPAPSASSPEVWGRPRPVGDR
ncbi:MAG TPA: hypothetical protein VLX92_25820 [Kofleriaceae bacterium]|nr:hypothetical protein [Kofleriaceae bacterium]